MYKDIVDKKGNTFYALKADIVNKAQDDLGIIIPVELKEFYDQIGYGFLRSEEENFNRILDPYSLCEFRFREGQFANSPDLDIYEEDERDKLIFFEICEGVFLSIGFSKENKGKIFSGNKQIADSLREFLIKYQTNEDYWEVEPEN